MNDSLESKCDHGITFDEIKAKGKPVHEVRLYWPRGVFTKENPCPKGCDYEGIYYASTLHYLYGDW